MKEKGNGGGIGAGSRGTAPLAAACLLALVCAASLPSCAPDAEKVPAGAQPSPSDVPAGQELPPDSGNGGIPPVSEPPPGDVSNPTAPAAPTGPTIPPNSTESSRRVRFLNQPRAITVTVESLFGNQVRRYQGLTPGGVTELPCGLSGCLLRAHRVDGSRRIDDREFTSEAFQPGTCGVIEASADHISFQATDCSFR